MSLDRLSLSGRGLFAWAPLFGTHHILDRPYPVDLYTNHIAIGEPFRRLHHSADAAWRAGEEDVAGKQRHHLRKIGDLIVAIEDEMVRIRRLPLLAVHEATDRKIVRIDRIGGEDRKNVGEGK